MSDHTMFLLAAAGVATFLVAIFLPHDLADKYAALSSAISSIVTRLRNKRRENLFVDE
jgi:hypothetical protein